MSKNDKTEFTLLESNYKLRSLVNIYATIIDDIPEEYLKSTNNNAVVSSMKQATTKTKKYLFTAITSVLSPVFRIIKIPGMPYTALMVSDSKNDWIHTFDDDYDLPTEYRSDNFNLKKSDFKGTNAISLTDRLYDSLKAYEDPDSTVSDDQVSDAQSKKEISFTIVFSNLMSIALSDNKILDQSALFEVSRCFELNIEQLKDYELILKEFHEKKYYYLDLLASFDDTTIKKIYELNLWIISKYQSELSEYINEDNALDEVLNQIKDYEKCANALGINNKNLCDRITSLKEMLREAYRNFLDSHPEFVFEHGDTIFRVDFEHIEDEEFQLYKYMIEQNWTDEKLQAIRSQNWLCLPLDSRKILKEILSRVLVTEKWSILNNKQQTASILEDMTRNVPNTAMDSLEQASERIKTIQFSLQKLNEENVLIDDPTGLFRSIENHLHQQCHHKPADFFSSSEASETQGEPLPIPDNLSAKYYSLSKDLLKEVENINKLHTDIFDFLSSWKKWFQ